MKLKQKDLDLAKRQVEMGVMKGRVAKNLGISASMVTRMISSNFELDKFYPVRATKASKTFAKEFKYPEIGGLLVEINRNMILMVALLQRQEDRDKLSRIAKVS